MSRRPALLIVVAVLLITGAPASALGADPPTSDGSITLADGTVLPAMTGPVEPSVHAQMLAEHAGDPMAFEAGGQPTILLDPDGTVHSTADAVQPDVVTESVPNAGTVASLPNGLRKEVFGFLPYWTLNDAALAGMNYNLVSTIAYFSVAAASDGNLVKGTTANPSTGWAGWTSSRMTQVIDRAHAEGVRVVLTVTMMAWDQPSWDRMATLLNSSANRGRLVGQIVDAVRSRGADGVNLDFELVPSSLRAQYTAFVRQVKAALVAGDVGAYLTVCTTGGAATWATGYDIGGLTASGAADGIFVMGYDFHWSGSARAGGVAPIDSPYVLDVASAMGDFLDQAPAAKLIWGVPYYGRGWYTTNNQLNGITTGGSWAYYYTGHLSEVDDYGRLWDAVGKVPWYRYYNSTQGKWAQVYYDDPASLGYKYDLVNRHGLGGTGMWHLLMDNGRNELWRLIANRFVTDTAPPAGGVTVLPQKTDMSAIYVSWLAIDYASGLDYYNVQVRDRSTTSWANWLVGTRSAGAYYFGTPGKTYEFRVQAVDYRGNKQPWRVAPGMASEVRPGAFARVITSSLNVRSGPATSYGIVDTLTTDDRVYVMDGPVAAGGYTWFQVQYGFAQWPSAEYPLIGWVALGSGGDTYLTPSYAPSVTRLDPFVSGYGRLTTALSPNGDGVRDGVTVRYSLRSAVSSVRVDVVDPGNDIVRRFTVGGQSAGTNTATWDGRTDGGAWAPAGRYLVKVFATDASGTHPAPVAGMSSTVLARWGVTADIAAPKVTSANPGNGRLVPATTDPTVTFSEAMMGLSDSTVTLSQLGGSSVAVDLTWNAAARTLTVSPEATLAAGKTYRLSLGSGVADVAGNPLPAWSSDFTVPPGTVYPAGRRVRVTPGTYSGYVIDADGDLMSMKTLTFTQTSGATVVQRSALPDLPGRWLAVADGAWERRWLPESAGTSLAGETERWAWPSTTRLTFAEGSHTGVRFDTAGNVLSTRTVTLSRESGANTTVRAIINGRAYWWVINGAFAGHWLPESGRLRLRGTALGDTFASGPRIGLAGGTYTGYVYDAAGNVTDWHTATLSRASGAAIDGWAVINGRTRYHVANGIWAGTWLTVEPRVTLTP